MVGKKILLITNESGTVLNFRKELIKYFQSRGNKITVISGDSEKEEEIKKLNVAFECIPFSNRSKNPFSFISLKKRFVECIKRCQPDIVFTFQIKPNIIGCLASKKAKINNVVSMVEGLGDPFQPKTIADRIVLKIVIFLYRIAFRYARLVFFLNNNDKNVFVDRKIIDAKKSRVINGIGIDTKTNLPAKNLISSNNVVMLSRLLYNKGIFEYCELAKEVRKKRKDIYFYLYGKESQITTRDLQEYIQNKDIIYGGEISNVEEAYKNSRIYVSTSHREGFPRTLLEAMAYGIPTFATDVVGNNSAIVNNKTGYLFDLKDMKAFSKAIIDSIDNTDELDRIRASARKRCELEFDSNVINQKIESLIDEVTR